MLGRGNRRASRSGLRGTSAAERARPRSRMRWIEPRIRGVEPFSVESTISRSREEVFEYLADIANHAEFTDHYLTDWRLTREDSYGAGAGARFRMKAPLSRFSWADTSFAEVQPPRRIVERGRGG